MALTLEKSTRKLVVWTAFSFGLVLLAFSTRDLLASYFAAKTDLPHLRLASRLDPGNAEYRYRLGRLFAFVENDPAAALPYYRSAVELNPHNARYWLDLAAAYQVTGDVAAQGDALEHATRANPTNPDVAWEAGNFFVVQGDTDRAFRQLRVVLENQPNMAPAVLQLCWRVLPDADQLLARVVPATPGANLAFLTLLMGKKDAPSAAKVWQRLIDLRQPFDTRYLLQYISFLVGERQVDQAREAWLRGATLLKLGSYLPADNLVVNGDFSQDVLNGGFDWIYQTKPGVSLVLDPTQFHSGHRSLSITFDGAGINDAGIYQLVPVRPRTHYGFIAYFKADQIQGAGGPVVTVRDFYSGQAYFTSEELKDSDVWKPVQGDFTTAPDTQLLLIRIERIPPGNAIRGRLWVDNFELILR